MIAVSDGLARLRAVRANLLSAPDAVCLERARLITEAWQRHEHEPPALRRALAFEHLLANMTLDLDTNPYFAGNTSTAPRAWMLVPEHGFHNDGQVIIEHTELAGMLDGQIADDLLDYWTTRSFGGNSGVGHLAVDLDRVVHQGLESILAELVRREGDGSVAQQVYRYAMSISLRAVIGWANRYADAAAQRAGETDDPELAALHRRVAEACRQVPARPARNLFEGLQAIALVHLAIALEGHGMSVSIGLPDRVLAPFAADPDAVECIAAFMLKITANSIFGKASKTQAITIGGADDEGRDCCNALTSAFLEACRVAAVGDPHVFLRWHDSLDPKVAQLAAEMLAEGRSMPLLIGDRPTAEGFIAAGVAPVHAWQYCVIGCNELGIPGLSAESATATFGSTQPLETLHQTLAELPEPDALPGMDALLDAYEARLSDRLMKARENGRRQKQRSAELVPTPFCSALMTGCAERGEDLRTGMVYHLPNLYERGLTNAANALAAIEHLVFEQQRLKLSELLAATGDDFGDGALLRELRRAPKWGNDDARADRWALRLLDIRERVLDRIDAACGDAGHLVCHVVRSLHHLDGRKLGATVDGRRAHQPLCDSLGAETGTAQQGPTAVLNSVLKIDPVKYYKGGTNLNLTLGPEAGPRLVTALIEGFFGQGGQELQINRLDASILRAAQADPTAHGDLVVRIAGFSARFVDLSAAEQNELIARAEAAA